MSISKEDLMRYLDGELEPEQVTRVERALGESTELRRELAIFRALHADLEGLPTPGAGRGSVWRQVNQSLNRPVGWILVAVGSVLWSGYGLWVFANSPSNPVQKLAVAALVVGFLIMLVGTILERSAEWKVDPYRDVER